MRQLQASRDGGGDKGMFRWGVIGLLVIWPLVVALALVWVARPSDSVQAAPAATVAPAPPDPASPAKAQALTCQRLGTASLAMSDELDDAFTRHAKAHHEYVAGKRPFGDPDNIKPGTVLWVWRETLAQRADYTPQYHRMRDAFKRECA